LDFWSGLSPEELSAEAEEGKYASEPMEITEGEHLVTYEFYQRNKKAEKFQASWEKTPDCGESWVVERFGRAKEAAEEGESEDPDTAMNRLFFYQGAECAKPGQDLNLDEKESVALKATLKKKFSPGTYRFLSTGEDASTGRTASLRFDGAVLHELGASGRRFEAREVDATHAEHTLVYRLNGLTGGKVGLTIEKDPSCPVGSFLVEWFLADGKKAGSSNSFVKKCHNNLDFDLAEASKSLPEELRGEAETGGKKKWSFRAQGSIDFGEAKYNFGSQGSTRVTVDGIEVLAAEATKKGSSTAMMRWSADAVDLADGAHEVIVDYNPPAQSKGEKVKGVEWKQQTEQKKKVTTA